jgi:effector-binding domain-containing protein
MHRNYLTTIKKTLAALGAILAATVVIGFFLPRTAHVERSITLEAPPATVFTVLNGFGQFQKWSPWAELDPQAQTTFEGPANGLGAKMSWSGNADAGTGSQEIIESTPFSRIRIRLVLGDFGGDFTSTYRIEPRNDGSQLTWAFDANYGGNVLGRYFGLFADALVGPDYERGLAKLKMLVDALPRADFFGLQISLVETRAEPVIMVGAHSPADPKSIGVTLGVAYGRLSGFMSAHGLKQVGPPIAIWHGEDKGALSLDAAIPVDRAEVPSGGAIRAGSTFAGPAVRAVYRGPYAGLAAAHDQVLAYLAAAGLKQAGPMWEQYVSDPGKTPDGELVTHLYYPIRD